MEHEFDAPMQITPAMLRAAIAEWDRARKAGEAASQAQADALPHEQAVGEIADHVWGVLKQLNPTPAERYQQMADQARGS